MSPLKGSGKSAAVYDEVLTGNIARLGAAHKRAQIAEFGRVTEPAGRVCLAPAGDNVIQVLAGFFRRRELGLAQAVGIERSRQNIVDGDVVNHRRARQAGDKSGQPGARAIGQAQDIDGRLDGNRGDIDDAAELAFHHAVDRRLDQENGAEHVGVERGDPVVAVPIPEITGRWPTGIVDENIGRAAFFENGGAALFGGDIGDHRSNFGAGGREFPPPWPQAYRRNDR